MIGVDVGAATADSVFTYPAVTLERPPASQIAAVPVTASTEANAVRDVFARMRLTPARSSVPAWVVRGTLTATLLVPQTIQPQANGAYPIVFTSDLLRQTNDPQTTELAPIVLTADAATGFNETRARDLQQSLADISATVRRLAHIDDEDAHRLIATEIDGVVNRFGTDDTVASFSGLFPTLTRQGMSTLASVAGSLTDHPSVGAHLTVLGLRAAAVEVRYAAVLSAARLRLGSLSPAIRAAAANETTRWLRRDMERLAALLTR